MPPIIDRLVFVLQWFDPQPGPNTELLQDIRAKVKSAIAAGRCKWTPIPSRYFLNFTLILQSGAEARINIGAKDANRQKGGICIDINPSKLESGDIRHFKRMMRKIVGPEFNRLMLAPLINHLDIAADIKNLLLTNVLVMFRGAQQHSLFCQRMKSGGLITGCNMGSVSSDYMDAVYGKNDERAVAAVRNIAKNGIKNEELVENAIRQLKSVKRGPNVVRVEVRGKKLRGKRLVELQHLPNRFKRFQFADLAGAGPTLPDWLCNSFHALCWQNGVKHALEEYRDSPHWTEINAYWKARQATWWKPEDMWVQACEELRTCGLFPESAFDE